MLSRINGMPTDNKPIVICGLKFFHPWKSFTLKRILRDAVDQLDKAGAWPKEIGAITLSVREPLDPKTHTVPMRCVLETRDDTANDVIERVVDSAEIEISLNIFEEDAPKKLLGLGASRQDIALHFLGHEIHHLDEIERQNKCGIRLGRQHSAFAGAARPEFDEPWLDALRVYTEHFSNDTPQPASLLDAGETANEAAADLVGLYWMARARPAKAVDRFASILVRFRRSERALPKSRSYDTAAIIEAVFARHPQSPQAIHEACWARAVEQALASNDLPANVQAAFARLLTIPHVAVGPASGPMKSAKPTP